MFPLRRSIIIIIARIAHTSDLPHCDDDIGHLQYEDEKQSDGNECQKQAQLVASLVTPPVQCSTIGEEEAGKSVCVIDAIIVGTSPL